MELKRIIVLCILFLSFGCASQSVQEVSNFDIICNIVEEAEKKSADSKSRIKYIEENIRSRVKSKDAKDAMDAIRLVDPEKRYQVFKQAVEGELGQEWECNALKNYFY